jgi:amino acid permease
MLTCTAKVYALGELAVMYPVSGGFYTYSTRFIDPSWGFAMGWSKFSYGLD